MILYIQRKDVAEVLRKVINMVTVDSIINDFYFDYVFLNNKCWDRKSFIAHTKRFGLGSSKWNYEIDTIHDYQILTLY